MNCMLGDDEYTLIRKSTVVSLAVAFIIGWALALTSIALLYAEKQTAAQALNACQRDAVGSYNEGIDVGVAIAESAAKQKRKPCMTPEFIRGVCFRET